MEDLGVHTDKIVMKRQVKKKSKERVSHYQDGVKVNRKIKKGGHYSA